MVEIEDAGWRQVSKTEDKSAIKEEEVRTLFNMIDKDRSGSLSKRVRSRTVAKVILINKIWLVENLSPGIDIDKFLCFFCSVLSLIRISGSEEGSETN